MSPDSGPVFARLRAVAVAASLAASLVAFSERAAANGRFPATNAIVLAPRDPSTLVLRASYGVLVSHDAGKSWDWVCEQSLGFSGIEDPPLAVTESGAIVGALFAGVTVSPDRGCSFSFAGGAVSGRVVNDVVLARARPREVLAIASSYARRGDAGESLYQSDVYRTTDEGRTFVPAPGALDPSILFETIEIAESDPSRIYLSGARDVGTGREGVVLVSRDGGGSFESHVVPLRDGERAPYIGAVDPSDPDRVYVRTGGAPDLARSRLLVSDDGARTFREAFSSDGPMTGLAISPDGAKVYVGSAKDGLLVAPRDSLVFEQRAKIYVQCITVSATRVYLCSNELYGFVAGESTDDGRTFTPMLRLAGLRGPLACAEGTSTHDQCEKEWPRVREELGGGGAVRDAGTTDAGPSSSSPPSGCGAAGGLGGGATSLGVGVLFALRAARLRRRSGGRPR